MRSGRSSRCAQSCGRARPWRTKTTGAAVRAALALRQWIAEEADELQVRMAVNTGVALVSLDSRPHEGEAIAAGDVVKTTQRLQVVAAPVNGILVGK
jgi:class 3 adenylate cyclase